MKRYKLVAVCVFDLARSKGSTRNDQFRTQDNIYYQRNIMKFINLLALAMTAAPQVAASTTYSGIFTATSAISFVTLANAKYGEVETGICIGGTASCGVFSGSNNCPYPSCETEYAPVDPSKPVSSSDPNTDTCVASANNPGGQVACANLPEYLCNAATRNGYTDCKFVRLSGNQRAINAVLVAFTTTSLVVLLAIAVILLRRLPKKETVLTQPLLDEENAE